MARLDQLVAAPVAESELSTPMEYSLSEQFSAAFQEFNSLGAFSNMFADDIAELGFANNEIDFDPYDGTFPIREGYEDLYAEARTPEEVGYINQQIDLELKNEEILASSNPAIALGAGLLDPINILPLSMIGKGKSALSFAGRVAGTSALVEVGVEAMQQSAQKTRTIEESIKNVGITALLSGAFGGALGAMSKYDPSFDAKSFIKRAEEDFDNAVAGSVGAARVGDDVSLEDLGPADALRLEKVIKFQDPVSRVLSSPSRTARRIMSGLAEAPFIRKGSQGDVVSEVPVENWIKQWEANRAAFVREMDNFFVQYRQSNPNATGGAFKQIGMTVQDTLSRPKDKLTRAQFNEAVSHALRRGDKHEIPEVAKAAQMFRNEVIAPLAREAMKVKKKDGTSLLPDDLDLTETSNYLMRLWDKNKILKNSRAFDDLNIAYLKQKRDDALARISDWQIEYDRANQLLKEARRDARREITGAKSEITKHRDKLMRLERDMRHAKNAVRKAENHWKKLTKRAEEFRPDSIGDDRMEYAKLLRDLKRGGLANEPISLAGFVRRQGGVRDEGGDLASQDISKATTGIINNKSGKTLDEIGEAAQEVGYYLERPSIDELLEDIQADIRGEAQIYRSADEDFFMESSYIAELANTIERNGMNVNSIKDAAHLKKIIDNLPDANVHYRQSTPAARAKYREILWSQRRAAERMRQLDDVVIGLESDIIDAASELRNARRYGSVVAERIKKRNKDIRATERNVKAIRESLDKDKFYGSFTDSDIADVAAQLRERIIGGPAGRMEYDYKIGAGSSSAGMQKNMIGARGPLKERTYDIPDLFEMDGIKVEDFLVNDIESVAAAYTKSMGSQVGLVRQFGSLDLTDEIQEMRREFNILANRAKDQKTATKILQAKEAVERDITAIRDRLRGVYEIPDDYAGGFASSIRSMKTLNYMLYLGGMTVSAIPDIGRPIMVHGLRRVYGDGLQAMARNMSAFKLAAKEIPETGTAGDVTLNTRALAMADLDDYIDTASKIEGKLSRQSGYFSTMTLMPHWNSALKQFCGVIAQSRVIDSAMQWTQGALKRGDKTWMQDNFISKEMAKRIAAQFERYGNVIDGVKIPNARAWDDVEARDIFRAAIRRSVDNTIITPGLDKPLLASARGPLGQLGPLIFQFKSFAFASMGRTLLTGLQQRDMAALNGMSVMLGLGAFTYIIKELMAGREPDISPEKLVVEAVDRSGLGGWFIEANNMTERMTRGAFGLNALAGTGTMSRYAGRNLGGTLLGPTFGTLQNFVQASGALASGDFTQSDVRALRQLMIYQNSLAFSWLFNQAESGINNAFGVKTRSE